MQNKLVLQTQRNVFLYIFALLLCKALLLSGILGANSPQLGHCWALLCCGRIFYGQNISDLFHYFHDWDVHIDFQEKTLSYLMIKSPKTKHHHLEIGRFWPHLRCYGFVCLVLNNFNSKGRQIWNVKNVCLCIGIYKHKFCLDIVKSWQHWFLTLI